MKRILFYLSLLIYTPCVILSQTISTGQLSSLEWCTGSELDVSYNAQGVFNADNVFIAQISNNGFLGFQNIGNFKSMTSGIITVTIPNNLPSGDTYRIRVISSSPYIVGSNNGDNIRIVQKPSSGFEISTNYSFVLENEEIKFKLNNSPERYYSNSLWSFGEGASFSSFSGFNPPKVSYTGVGEKKITCELTSTLNCLDPVRLESYVKVLGCVTDIDSSAFVDSVKLEYGMTGEPFLYEHVWILPTGSLSLYGAHNQTFYLETGASLTIKSFQSNCIFYLKPGSSLNLDRTIAKNIVLKSPGASSNNADSLDFRSIDCNDITYDYKTAPEEGIELMERLGYLSIEENDIQYNVTPNPASDFVEINGLEIDYQSINNEIQIFNMLGQCVQLSRISGGITHRVDTSHLLPGLYMLKANNYFSMFQKI
jgi:hypothetical protein